MSHVVDPFALINIAVRVIHSTPAGSLASIPFTLIVFLTSEIMRAIALDFKLSF
jgi:hypothetical protein